MPSFFSSLPGREFLPRGCSEPGRMSHMHSGLSFPDRRNLTTKDHSTGMRVIRHLMIGPPADFPSFLVKPPDSPSVSSAIIVVMSQHSIIEKLGGEWRCP